MDQEAVRFVTALMAYYGTYHNHKETMAYMAAAFYIGGAVALMVTSSRLPPSTLLRVVVIGVAVFGLVYVWWQLRNRHDAAVRAEGCISIATRWLQQPPAPTQLTPVEFQSGEGVWWPQALAEEFSRHRPVVWWRLWMVMLVTLGAMLLATFGAAWTVWTGDGP